MKESDRLEGLEEQIKVMRGVIQGLADRVLELEQRELQRLEREIEDEARKFKRMKLVAPEEPKSRWQRFKDWLSSFETSVP